MELNKNKDIEKDRARRILPNPIGAMILDGPTLWPTMPQQSPEDQARFEYALAQMDENNSDFDKDLEYEERFKRALDSFDEVTSDPEV